MRTLIQNTFKESIAVKIKAQDLLVEKIAKAAQMMLDALHKQGKIICCGNGGSASDAQHFSAELLNRFQMERPSLPALALHTDTSTLTAIANDYGYEQVFAKQVEGLGNQGDVLLAISTSGNAKNILTAIRMAQKKSLPVIALTGKDGGEVAKILCASDLEIRVPAENTARIQETHILILHCLADLVERGMFGN
jgi:phosphoheptose isomerase